MSGGYGPDFVPYVPATTPNELSAKASDLLRQVMAAAPDLRGRLRELHHRQANDVIDVLDGKAVQAYLFATESPAASRGTVYRHGLGSF